MGSRLSKLGRKSRVHYYPAVGVGDIGRKVGLYTGRANISFSREANIVVHVGGNVIMQVRSVVSLYVDLACLVTNTSNSVC